jgi:hypothetical protein
MHLDESACTPCEVEPISDGLLEGRVQHPLFVWPTWGKVAHAFGGLPDDRLGMLAGRIGCA